MELGQRVQKGQLLYRLDQGQVLPKVRDAQASLLKAEERLSEVQDWTRRPEFKQAVRARDLAEMELKRKKRLAVDTEGLAKSGIIPRNDLDNARADLVRAESELASAMERLTTTREKGSPQKLKIARLERLNAQAALQEAQTKLENTTVLAPAAGVAMRPKSKENQQSLDLPEQGSTVTEGQELLLIGADQPLGVKARISEASVRKIRLGQKTMVTLHALKGRPLAGKVTSIAPEAVLSQGRAEFPVVVELARLKPAVVQGIRVGMSASVRIITNEAEGAVKLPIVALSHRPGGPAVRIRQDKKLIWQPVTIGLSDHEFVQIIKGLKPGQTVWF